MSTKSLWGDLSAGEDKPTPIKILREQVALLSEASNGLLTGRVYAAPAPNDKMQIWMSIRVPALSGYSFQLLRVFYSPVEVYPLEIRSGRNEELGTAKDEAEFVQILERYLQDDRTKKMLQGLMAQAKAVEEKPSDESDPDS